MWWLVSRLLWWRWCCRGGYGDKGEKTRRINKPLYFKNLLFDFFIVPPCLLFLSNYMPNTARWCTCTARIQILKHCAVSTSDDDCFVAVWNKENKSPCEHLCILVCTEEIEMRKDSWQCRTNREKKGTGWQKRMQYKHIYSDVYMTPRHKHFPLNWSNLYLKDDMCKRYVRRWEKTDLVETVHSKQ